MAQSRSNVAVRSSKARKSDANDAAVESLKRRNAALEAENRKLEQLAEYRSVFLARLAHELRTPLTSILGFAEILLSQEGLSEPQRNFCERIQNSAQQLQTSLNQLAELSRLETGKSKLRREEFALEDLLLESCRAIAPLARKQGAEVRSKAAPELPLIVSDRGKLRQVIYNLLAYAISRSPAGTAVTVTGDKIARGFTLKFEDNGPALRDSEMGKLDSTNPLSANSELGLVIVRHNLDLLGARLSVRNRRPRGIEIVTEFPTHPPTTKHY